MVASIEETYRRDIQEVRGEVTYMGHRMDAGENSAAALENRLTQMELAWLASDAQAVEMRLLIEDHEDRVWRSNIHIKGIPKGPEGEDLYEVLQELFAQILELPIQENKQVKLDRAYRLMGTRFRADTQAPRYVICRLHHFTVRESLVQKA